MLENFGKKRLQRKETIKAGPDALNNALSAFGPIFVLRDKQHLFLVLYLSPLRCQEGRRKLRDIKDEKLACSRHSVLIRAEDSHGDPTIFAIVDDKFSATGGAIPKGQYQVGIFNHGNVPSI